MTDRELIKALRYCHSGDCEDCPAYEDRDCTWMVTYSGAADRLEALLAENERLKAQVPKWVSVEERLPQMHTEQIHDDDGAVYSFSVSAPVLVKPRDKEIAVAQYEISDEGRAIWADDGGTQYDVTHWMPLPSTEGVE